MKRGKRQQSSLCTNTLACYKKTQIYIIQFLLFRATTVNFHVTKVTIWGRFKIWSVAILFMNTADLATMFCMCVACQFEPEHKDNLQTEKKN